MEKKIKIDNHIHGMLLEKKVKDTIVVKTGLGYLEYTQEELQQELNDLSFLKDAFLVILNEDATKGSDLPFNREQVLKYAREMYEEENWNKEFIDKCFDVD